MCNVKYQLFTKWKYTQYTNNKNKKQYFQFFLITDFELTDSMH